MKPCSLARFTQLIQQRGKSAGALRVSFGIANHFDPEAADAALRSIAERPEMGPAHMCLAMCLAGMGDSPGARAAFNKARELAPDLLAARLKGQWLGFNAEYRERATGLLQAAAGLPLSEATGG